MVKLIYSFLPLGNNFLRLIGGFGTIGLSVSVLGAINLITERIKLKIIETNLFKAILSRNFIYKLQYDIMVIHHISFWYAKQIC